MTRELGAGEMGNAHVFKAHIARATELRLEASGNYLELRIEIRTFKVSRLALNKIDLPSPGLTFLITVLFLPLVRSWAQPVWFSG